MFADNVCGVFFTRNVKELVQFSSNSFSYAMIRKSRPVLMNIFLKFVSPLIYHGKRRSRWENGYRSEVHNQEEIPSRQIQVHDTNDDDQDIEDTSTASNTMDNDVEVNKLY